MNKTSLFLLILKLSSKIIPMLTKTLKFSKVGWLVASLGVYSYLFTWQFALLFVSSIFIHELGHVFAMKNYDMSVKGIYMIPFLGGVAVSDDTFKNRYEEIIVSIYGSVFGVCVSFILMIMWLYTDNIFYLASASWVAFVNIFNLLPINPMDGGRVFKSIVFSISGTVGLVFLLLGLIFTVILAIKINFIIFVLLLIAGGLELISEWLIIKNKEIKITPANKKEIIFGGILYLGMVYVLYSIMDFCHRTIPTDLLFQIMIG